MCEAPAVLGLSAGALLPTPGGGGGGGGTFDVLLLERAIPANTHPIKVPMNSASWVPNNTRVLDWIPINTGNLLCRRKECLSTSVIGLSSEEFPRVPEGGGGGGASSAGL